MSQSHSSSPMLYTQVDVTAGASARASGGSTPMEHTELLREVLAAQDRTNEILEELLGIMAASHKQRLQELHHWKNANPRLSESCREAAETLSRVQVEYLERLTEEIQDTAEDMSGGESWSTNSSIASGRGWPISTASCRCWRNSAVRMPRRRKRLTEPATAACGVFFLFVGAVRLRALSARGRCGIVNGPCAAELEPLSGVPFTAPCARSAEGSTHAADVYAPDHNVANDYRRRTVRRRQCCSRGARRPHR
jgi:hypothetical protein